MRASWADTEIVQNGPSTTRCEELGGMQVGVDNE